MLDFLDHYFEVLTSKKVLRLTLCKVLVYLENDIRYDNLAQQKQLVSLIERDPTLQDDQLNLEFDKARIKESND